MVDNLILHLNKQHNLTENDIVSIFRTGGTLLCTSCKDTDYVVVVNSPKRMQHMWSDKTDNTEYFITDYQTRKKLLSLTPPYNLLHLYILDELFKPNTTIYGDHTCELNLLMQKDKYLDMLRDQVPKTFTHPCLRWKNYKTTCNRHLWWAILGLQMIENNSYEITPEMRNIIQKCHDGILEKKWENWVLDKLNIKKEGLN